MSTAIDCCCDVVSCPFFRFISFHFVSFHFISFRFISFHFIFYFTATAADESLLRRQNEVTAAAAAAADALAGKTAAQRAEEVVKTMTQTLQQRRANSTRRGDVVRGEVKQSREALARMHTDIDNAAAAATTAAAASAALRVSRVCSATVAM
jgi:hypothetical protein